MQWRPISEVRRLASKALENGAVFVSPTRVEWDLNAACDLPQSREVSGRGYLKGVYQAASVRQLNPGTLTVSLSGLPCRTCGPCLRVRAARWSDRAMREVSRSSRTWMVTLTLNPIIQNRVFMEELHKKTTSGWLDADFSEPDEFGLRCAGGFKLVTKFWKNVRKPQVGEEPISLRYICVAEAHKSGLPHYHALVHEQPNSAITYRRLADRWTSYGFFHGKLVDKNESRQVRYVTKYLAKSMISRVRASQNYGSQDTTSLNWFPPDWDEGVRHGVFSLSPRGE